MQIVILEDCVDREYHMRLALNDRMPQFDVYVFRSADEFIDHWRNTDTSEVILVSLDHDLIPENAADDWGDGREVAREISLSPQSCPIIVHSTNTTAVAEMMNTLRVFGWAVHRVIPIDGHRWIRRIWFPTARKLIVDSAVRSDDSRTPDGVVPGSNELSN